MGLRIRLRSEREQGDDGDVRAAAAVAEQELSVLREPETAPAAPRWFVSVDGVQQGPFEASDVWARRAAGHVTEDTLVWHEGMSGWLRLGDVAELGGAAER